MGFGGFGGFGGFLGGRPAALAAGWRHPVVSWAHREGFGRLPVIELGASGTCHELAFRCAPGSTESGASVPWPQAVRTVYLPDPWKMGHQRKGPNNLDSDAGRPAADFEKHWK